MYDVVVLMFLAAPPTNDRSPRYMERNRSALNSQQVRRLDRVPPNPRAGVGEIVVRCQVLECEPPSWLATSWSADGLADTQVI